MRYTYPCSLEPESESGSLVRYTDVPEALTGSRDRKEALAMAEDSLVVALGAYVKERQAIPSPSPVLDGQVSIAVSAVVAAKLDLYTAMQQKRVSEKELGSRLGLTPSAISRLTDPRRRSLINGIERALRGAGRGLVVESPALLQWTVGVAR